MSAISRSNDALEILRSLGLRARTMQGLEDEIVFTCDSCGMRSLCRHVYAPANVGDVCTAKDVGVAARYRATDLSVVKKQHSDSSMESFSHLGTKTGQFSTKLPTIDVKELPFDEEITLSGGVP